MPPEFEPTSDGAATLDREEARQGDVYLGGETDVYSEANIKVLEGIEAMRLRPGMYIGRAEPGGRRPHA